MAGSSIRRSKRLRRNASNGVGGLALGRWFGIPGYSVLGRGVVFRLVYSFRGLGVGCPTGGVGYRGWVCVVHVLGNNVEVDQNMMVERPFPDDFVSPSVVLPPRVQADPPLDNSNHGLANLA
nr:hypothetical protein Iba_chr02bCG9930 [Ipomoea batatas]GMC98418.1 hypothetical protein Iba_chr05dCG16340 [Ipomoea batatas]